MSPASSTSVAWISTRWLAPRAAAVLLFGSLVAILARQSTHVSLMPTTVPGEEGDRRRSMPITTWNTAATASESIYPPEPRHQRRLRHEQVDEVVIDSIDAGAEVS